MNYPKISIVTINLNNARFLEETIQSVLSQNYPNLEYIIIDGGSTDGSIDIIKKHENQLAYWVSEKDDGYGFALQKGFRKATGEIMAWLNSDDVYHPGSLFAVTDFFSKYPQVKWLTGFPSWLSEKSYRVGEMPNIENSFWKKRSDLYLKYSRWSRIRYLGGDFQAIQQESTFWKRKLWEKAGKGVNTDYKLAVDTELWCRFFRHENLYTMPALLASFRYGSEGQITRVKKKEYFEECLRILKKENDTFGFSQKANFRIRFLLAQVLKPFYYFDFPLGFLYERLLKIPTHPD